ncbi:MAG: hypothetical protein WA667_14205 [Candidatus Nitrosopolaris sp.]
MTQKNRQALIAKPIIIIVGVGLVMMMTLASVVSMASAQQPQTSGTIASLQNGKNGMPTWIASGGWDFKNINSSSPAFNSTFNMVMLNGTAPHKHTITDFKMTGSPTKSGMATTYNGTATVTMKGMTMSSVPISIKLIGRAMSLWIDPTKTMGHFGNTPIYGFIG